MKKTATLGALLLALALPLAAQAETVFAGEVTAATTSDSFSNAKTSVPSMKAASFALSFGTINLV